MIDFYFEFFEKNYKAKIIQATAKFKAGVMAATGAIFLMYIN